MNGGINVQSMTKYVFDGKRSELWRQSERRVWAELDLWSDMLSDGWVTIFHNLDIPYIKSIESAQSSCGAQPECVLVWVRVV